MPSTKNQCNTAPASRLRQAASRENAVLSEQQARPANTARLGVLTVREAPMHENWVEIEAADDCFQRR